MASNPIQSFRFNSLPGEIRNEIYRILLCSFESTSTPRYKAAVRTTDHSIDTAILRTSKTVYHEAYNIMIKTNRFVRLTFPNNDSFDYLLFGKELPVVTMDTEYVNQFKGYVLSMSLSMKTDGTTPITSFNRSVIPLEDPIDFMLLYQDLHLFCRRFDYVPIHVKSFDTGSMMTITVAPMLTESQTTLRHDYFGEFFSETMQEDLLRPFRKIRGVNTVQVGGAVSRAIATAVETEMSQDKWSDPQELVDGTLAANKLGEDVFREPTNEYGEQTSGKYYFWSAWAIWEEAACLLGMIHRSPSWKGLAGKGGRRFLQDIGWLCLVLQLNQIHSELVYEAAFVSSNLVPGRPRSVYWLIRRATEEHCWARGYAWAPSRRQKAQLASKLAGFFTLVADPSRKAELPLICEALELSPDDGDVDVIIKDPRSCLSLADD